MVTMILAEVSKKCSWVSLCGVTLSSEEALLEQPALRTSASQPLPIGRKSLTRMIAVYSSLKRIEKVH
jgi:hypothetical protein